MLASTGAMTYNQVCWQPCAQGVRILETPMLMSEPMTRQPTHPTSQPSIQPTIHQGALTGLLDYICGRGKFGHFGNIIHLHSNGTHPNGHSSNGHINGHQLTYECCMELERRGLIYRHMEECGDVVFKPTEKALRGEVPQRRLRRRAD
jgi:hypothetical protein